MTVFNVNVSIPTEIVCDLLASIHDIGLEWVGSITPKHWLAEFSSSKWWYLDEEYVGSMRLLFVVKYDGPDDAEGSFASERTCAFSDIIVGLEKMSAKNPYQFSCILSGDYDATTADVFFQFVVMGEEIYG